MVIGMTLNGFPSFQVSNPILKCIPPLTQEKSTLVSSSMLSIALQQEGESETVVVFIVSRVSNDVVVVVVAWQAMMEER